MTLKITLLILYMLLMLLLAPWYVPPVMKVLSAISSLFDRYITWCIEVQEGWKKEVDDG